jgi:hypothetical protein
MDSTSKDILYNYSLRNYLNKNDVCIDKTITKDYQYEICYKKLKYHICYNLSPSFEIKVNLNAQNEYVLELDDIKLIIQKVYDFNDSEIDVLETYSQKVESHLDGWSAYPQTKFLWFKLIKISYYNGTVSYDPYYKLDFEIDIDTMTKLLKFRNFIIYTQRKFHNKLYNPINGIFMKRAAERFYTNNANNANNTN